MSYNTLKKTALGVVMAKEYENQSIREYGNRKKRYKRRRNILIVTLLLAVVSIFAIYMAIQNNRCYKSYKVVNSKEIVTSTVTGYLSFGSNIVKYGKDGAAAYNRTGKQVWNSSYNMSDPISDQCGNYIAIADRGGNSVHIFGSKGETGSFKTLYNITKIEVSYRGVTAVMMQEGERYYIKLYDQDGTDLLDFKRSVKQIGYPLDMSLSNDGQKMVLSCLAVSNGDLVSKVGCYNFDNVGENVEDNYVGGYKYNKGIVAPKIVFLNNDTFCVYRDNGFSIYSMKERPSVVKEINLKGTIQSILYNQKNTAVIVQSEDGSVRHLMLYNLKGKLVLNKPIDFDYKKIYMTDQEFIMYNDMNCIIMRMNGNQKFKGTFKTELAGIYPINNLDEYYLISETKLSDMKLK